MPLENDREAINLCILKCLFLLLRISLQCMCTPYLFKDVERRPGYKIWPFLEVPVHRKLRKMKAFNDYFSWRVICQIE